MRFHMCFANLYIRRDIRIYNSADIGNVYIDKYNTDI